MSGELFCDHYSYSKLALALVGESRFDSWYECSR
jgi:hypothetical protein